jgi:hypothetical protein
MLSCISCFLEVPFFDGSSDIYLDVANSAMLMQPFAQSLHDLRQVRNTLKFYF